MSFGRIFTSLFTAAVVATATTAVAANVGVNTRSLGAGASPITRCGMGFTIHYSVYQPPPVIVIIDDEEVEQPQPAVVTHVTVHDVPPACAGGTLHLAVISPSGSRIDGTGPPGVLAQSPSTTVNLSSTPLQGSVHGVRFVILGGAS